VGTFWSGYVHRNAKGTVVEVHEPWFGAITHKVRFPNQTIDYLTEDDLARSGVW
jgi:hypothetical protein